MPVCCQQGCPQAASTCPVGTAYSGGSDIRDTESGEQLSVGHGENGVRCAAKGGDIFRAIAL